MDRTAADSVTVTIDDSSKNEFCSSGRLFTFIDFEDDIVEFNSANFPKPCSNRKKYKGQLVLPLPFLLFSDDSSGKIGNIIFLSLYSK